MFWGRIWLLGDTVIRIKMSIIKNGGQFWLFRPNFSAFHRHSFSPEALYFPVVLINPFFAGWHKLPRQKDTAHGEIENWAGILRWHCFESVVSGGILLIWLVTGINSVVVVWSPSAVAGGLCRERAPSGVIDPVCLRHPCRKGWILLWRDRSLSSEYKGSLDD